MPTAIDIDALRASRARVLALFEQPEPWLDRSYAPGKWTARQILFHIADTETVVLDRIRRGIADLKPLLWAFDQDEWAIHLATAKRDLRAAAGLFAAARDSVIDLAGAVDPTRFERAVVHSERGKMLSGDWFALAVKHSGHHAEQVEAIAAGRPWPAPATP